MLRLSARQMHERFIEMLFEMPISPFSKASTPPNKFMQTCRYEKLKECVENREIDVDRNIMTALGEIDAGNLRAGADLLADHEQRDVVQPVYERHKETFEDLATAESWVPGDQTSIPVSYDCTLKVLCRSGTWISRRLGIV